MQRARSCPVCGYDTSAVPGHTCPECGEDERNHVPVSTPGAERFQQTVAQNIAIAATIGSVGPFALIALSGCQHGLHSHERAVMVGFTVAAAWSLITLFFVRRRKSAIGRLSGPAFVLLLVAEAVPLAISAAAFLSSTRVTH